MTRDVPLSFAPVIAHLELEEAFLVTMDDLEAILERTSTSTATRLVAKRLRDRGWLLPTETPGVWEFAPGSHAGPIGRGHPFREVLAASLAHGDLDIAVCLASALWTHRLLDRAPSKPEVAVPKGARIPKGLARAARVVRYDRRLPTVELRGTPVHRLESVLVHLADRPADVASWGGIRDALPELVARVDREALEHELEDRPATVGTRLAYLTQALAPDFAERVANPGHGKVWFGPRAPLKRHDARFDVADTVLPFDPAKLSPKGSDR